MGHARGLVAVALIVVIALAAAAPGAAAPEGQMTWAVHISLAPTWFDPAETSGIITPFMMLYAIHDAMVKPMPGNPAAPSLAESWSVSPGWARLRVRRIQQLMHEKVIVAPIWLNARLAGLGPRVEESGIGIIAGYAFSAPYEDVNHSPRAFFLSSVSMKMDDGHGLWFQRDSIFETPNAPQKIESGDAYSFHALPATFANIDIQRIVCAEAHDKIGRVFSSDPEQTKRSLERLMEGRNESAGAR